MTVVQTLSGLTDVQPNWWPSPARSSVQLYGGLSADYATLYRTQPNVRVCVDFLARNIAQLGLHVFRRVSDTDRQRLADHPLAQLIKRPNPFTTRYRRISALMTDLGIYFNAYELKVSDPVTGRLALVRIPPRYMRPIGGLMPTSYELTVSGQRKVLAPDEVVHYRGDNPDNPLLGLSPLETLRRELAEEEARADDREHYWRNAARMEGIIERPANAPDWSNEARDQFAVDFAMRYAGSENAGKAPVLEDGMTYKATAFSAEQSQYVESRKLTREECTRAYHIPLPMAGILDHATFSNVKEQHKQLYQDCLGPWLVMLEEEHELQILPEFADIADLYLEFNIAEKLAGSFEDQASVLQQAVGRPWMAPNEARARINLPKMPGDADKLAVPVNLVIDDPSTGVPTQTDTAQARIADVQRRTLNRQRQVIAKRLRAGDPLGEAWDTARWNRELAADLGELGVSEPLAAAQQINAQHRALVEGEYADD